MRAFILMAAAVCCHAAPQMTVPVSYMSNALVLPSSPAVLPYSPALLGPSAEVPALPFALSALQYRAQDEFGTAALHHLGGPNFRSEVRMPFGAQVGGFSYIDGAGQIQHRTYVADIFGNRVAGTDLPVAPEETAEVAEQRATLAELKPAERRRRSAMLKIPAPITQSKATDAFSVPVSPYTTSPIASRPIEPTFTPKETPALRSGFGPAEKNVKTPIIPAAKPLPEAQSAFAPAEIAAQATIQPIPVADQPALKPLPEAQSAFAPAEIAVKATIQPISVADQPALKAVEAPKPALRAETPKPVAQTKTVLEPIKIESDESAEFEADSEEELKPVLKVQEPIQPLIKSAEPTPVKPVKVAEPAPAPAPIVKAAPAPIVIKAAPAPIVIKAAPVQPVAAVAVAAPVRAVPVAAAPTPLQAPNPPAPSPEVPYHGGKFHSQDELGQYSFGHFGGSHSRLENKDVFGHTRGSFAYQNAEGEIHVRKYAAGIGVGFTVAGSDLPVDTNKPVEYTPEVVKARNAHLALRQKEIEAKKKLEVSEPAPTPA